MTQDQVFVPKTRSQLGLPAFNPAGENLEGSSVTDEVMNELWEACGDAPLGAVWGSFSYLVCSARRLCSWAYINCTCISVLRLAYVLDQECIWPETLPKWH